MHALPPSPDPGSPETLKRAGCLAGSPDTLLTEAQAAHLLSLKPRTLQMWRMRGTGPHYVKLGSTVRYRISTLSAWLDARTVRSTAGALPGGAQ